MAPARRNLITPKATFMINNQFQNTRTVLSELLGSIQEFRDAIDFYFDHVDEGEILNPLLARGKIDTHGNMETLPPEFFHGFGISSLILDTLHGRLSLSEKNFIDMMNRDEAEFKWLELKNDLIVDDLKMLFNNCQVVEFDNWANVKNASDIWDNLRRDVLKPIKRRDFDFIFYLGDASQRPAYEVDEFIDIISDYSIHGRVTLVLDEQNAGKLWSMFFGQNCYTDISTRPVLSEQCRSIFDLINIGQLIVESFPTTVLFSRQGQMEIAVRRNSGTVKDRRKHFDAGYMLGLTLGMNISHSMALGLTVSGAYVETGSKPDGRVLSAYLEKWIGEIESFDPQVHLLAAG